MAPRAPGTATPKNTRKGEAPNVRAASSNPVSSWRNADSTAMTRNGMATNTCAITIAVRVNGNEMPHQSYKKRPNTPLRPNDVSNAIPPTTGGRTIGTMQMVRIAPRPFTCARAKNHARGTPNRVAITAAITDVSSETKRASRVALCEAILPNSDHGARKNNEINGRATKRTAAPAMARRPREAESFLMAQENRTSIAHSAGSHRN